MIPYQRQKKILSVLENRELLTFDELKEMFHDVSESTLRRDIKKLEKENRLEHLSGGAIKLASTIGEIPIETRSTQNSEEKIRIAEIASRFVEDGDVIYLDSGSSCTELYKKIFDKNITIYTTNTDILAMKYNGMANLIVVCGQFNAINSSVSGSLTEELLKNLFFSKAFLGANGVDIDNGVTTPTNEEAMKKRLVKKHSDRVYLLCDHTKFHKTSHVKSFELSNFTLISDKGDIEINKYINVIYE